MKNKVLLWSTIYETHYMKNKVLLWSTSVEKEIVTLPFHLFSFFLFFFFLGLSFFSFFLLGNALIMMIITLSLITTYELQLETRTRYDSIWMPSAVYRGWCNESRVTCMKNYAWWLCHKCDVNYMIMRWQYDKSKVCHEDDEENGGKLHGNISRNGYGNAHL